MDRETVLELADWLAKVREGNEESIARNDPVIRDHLARLAKWEKVLRDMVAVDAPKCEYCDDDHKVKAGWQMAGFKTVYAGEDCPMCEAGRSKCRA